MLRLLVLTLLLTTTATANAPDIEAIISGLNAKARGILKSVSIPVLNNQDSSIKEHIDGLVGFFKAKEGDIPLTNTPFTIHYSAERCHLFGKRLLLVDFQKCKATAEESKTGLKSTCEKGSQKDAIECATEQVINLMKIISITLKKKDQNGQN